MTFSEVMNSNVRPKCEPEINIRGHAYNNNVKYTVRQSGKLFPMQNNGKTAGDLSTPITAVQLIYVGNRNVIIECDVKQNDEWSGSYGLFKGDGVNPITSIKIKLEGKDKEQFTLRYRVYIVTEKEKFWGDWHSPDEEAGYTTISGIEILLIHTDKYVIDENVNLTWTAKDVQNVTYVHKIDPIGRELPSLELTWTEIYTGEFSKDNLPIKYENACKYLPVDLSFSQNISFDTDDGAQKVSMPRMFLKSNPEIIGKTIKWTAVDALSLLVDEQKKRFSEDSRYYLRKLVNIMIDSRSSFLQSKELFEYLSRSIDEILTFANSNELTNMGLPGAFGVIIDGKANSEIMHYLSQTNYFLDFESDRIVIKSLNDVFDLSPIATIDGNVMYSFPDLEAGKNISQFNSKIHINITQPDKTYTLSPVETTEYSGYKELTYYFDGYGRIEDESAYHPALLNYEKRIVVNGGETDLNVLPISVNETNKSRQTYLQGEPYEENCRAHVLYYSDKIFNKRFEALTRYFSENKYSGTVTTLPRFDISAGSVAKFETLLFNNQKKEMRNFLIVGETIDYRGSLRSTYLLHEV